MIKILKKIISIPKAMINAKKSYTIDLMVNMHKYKEVNKLIESIKKSSNYAKESKIYLFYKLYISFLEQEHEEVCLIYKNTIKSLIDSKVGNSDEKRYQKLFIYVTMEKAITHRLSNVFSHLIFFVLISLMD